MIESDKVSVARMLEQEDGDFVVAKQLAVIADAYGFDGWLLNIEAEFPLTVADPIGKATAFIRNLKRLLGTERLVIWYDAVNTDNEVDYQNGLTEKNVPFALAADSLFTNYKWTQAKIDQAKISSQWNGILPSEVRFGVDVWAQNTDMPPPARVTFPAKGGGGTNTGVVSWTACHSACHHLADKCTKAVRKLAENDFSTAIFAPAWTHEHFSTASHESIAASVERSMWEGLSLPSDLHCECTKGKPHHTLEYRSYPLVRSAREYPVGSSVFFSTDFRPAIPLADDGQYLSHLGSQAVQPHILPVSASDIEAMRSGPETRILYAEPPSAKTSGLTIRTKILGHDDHAPNLGRDPATKSLCRLCVFKVNMLADGTLEATFKFRAGSKRGQALIGFYTIYASQSSHELECKNNIIHYPSPDKVEHKTINISNDTPDSRLIELGVFCEGHNGIARHEKLLEIFDITVKSKNLPKVRWIIDDLHVTSHSNPETTQKRLKWRWTGPSDFVQSELLPWSKTTGPFSHFVISIAGAVVGEAYCHEFPLRDADFDKVQGDKTPRKEGRVEVLIQGVLFGGGSVRSEAMMISREEGSLGYE